MSKSDDLSLTCTFVSVIKKLDNLNVIGFYNLVIRISKR